MNHLIIGASGAAGQSTITAIRDYDSESNILATTSGADPVTGADQTLTKIDMREPADALKKVTDAVAPDSLRALFYTPAGGPVGYPVKEATPADIQAANAFCVDPIVAFAERLRPELAIGYSAFYWLPHLLLGYGSMAYAKLAQERLAIAEPLRYKMLRLGTFQSKSMRGAFLLSQRSISKPKNEAAQKLFDEWKATGRKFKDFFLDYTQQMEREAFGARFSTPYRFSDAETVRRGIVRFLEGEPAPILSGVGDWFWTDETLPELPEDFRL